MTTIKNLERQHQDIYNIINETKSMINGADLEGNSANIARNISVLAGKLKIHLSNEDKYLYPSLIKKGIHLCKIKPNTISMKWAI